MPLELNTTIKDANGQEDINILDNISRDLIDDDL